MRRTTLGGLSPAQLNSRNGPSRVMNSQGTKKRLTVGPVPRPSMGMQRPPPAEAVSRLSTGNPRGSSMYGGSKGSQVKSDPRPVSDRQYQQTCIRALIGYLTQHGYDHNISPKLLTSPTSKEFLHIVQFLFKRIDPSIKFVGKVEDEVPALFKRIGYPFQISKSALYAVGSPHTWPGLLAALMWIVELLTYEEKAEETKLAGGAFDDNALQNTFHEYVAQAYQFFLGGDDERLNFLDSQFEQGFQERELELSADMERLMQGNASLQQELQTLHTQPSPLQVQEKKKADLLSDTEKFNKLISSLQVHQQALEKKLDERKQDLAATQAERAELNAEEAKLRERIAAQEIKLADVDRMSKEKSKMKEILRSVSAQRDALDKVVWDNEVQLSKKLEELEGAVRTYHTTGDRLKLIPVSAKRANGVAYEISLNTRGSTPEEMVGTDLKGVIKPALLRLRESYSERLTHGRQEMLELQERRAASDALKSEAEETKETLEVQLKRVDAQYKAEKDKIDAELRSTSGEIETIDAAVAEMEKSSSIRLPQCEEEYKMALADYDKAKSECASEGKNVHHQLITAVNMLIDHKTHIEETLKSMGTTFSLALEDLEAPVV